MLLRLTRVLWPEIVVFGLVILAVLFAVSYTPAQGRSATADQIMTRQADVIRQQAALIASLQSQLDAMNASANAPDDGLVFTAARECAPAGAGACAAPAVAAAGVGSRLPTQPVRAFVGFFQTHQPVRSFLRRFGRGGRGGCG